MIHADQVQTSISLALMPRLNEVVRVQVAIRDPDGNLLEEGAAEFALTPLTAPSWDLRPDLDVP